MNDERRKRSERFLLFDFNSSAPLAFARPLPKFSLKHLSMERNDMVSPLRGVSPLPRRLLYFPLLLLTLTPPAAFGFPNEPEGFGKARFRMSLAQVKEIFPGLTGMPEQSAEGRSFLGFYSLDNQSFEQLKPCKLRFVFTSDHLYEIRFDCEPEDEVVALLTKKFGEPTTESARGTFWYGERTMVTLNPTAKTFAFVDRQLSQSVQTQLFMRVMGGQVGKPADPSGKDSEESGAAPNRP